MHRHRTRTIHDRFDPERRLAENEGTLILDRELDLDPGRGLGPGQKLDPDRDPDLDLDRHEARPVEELFVECYPEIRRALRHALIPGVVLVSVDGLTGAVGYVSLAADGGRPVAAIVGRHGRADLRLSRDPRVALRHMAVVLLPGEPRRVLLLDLNTGQGFEDERGVVQRAVLADGPVVFRLGRYVVFLLGSALARGMPMDAREAWARIPARVYLDEAAEEEAAARAPEAGAVGAARGPDREDEVSAPCVTHVSRIEAPRPAQRDLVEPGEQPLGELVVCVRGGGCELVRLGAAALARGVLVGRYERCATAVIRDGGRASVSRVHLLVIQLDGGLYAIDTASTNGSWVDGQEVRVVGLQDGARVALGGEDTWVEWRVLN